MSKKMLLREYYELCEGGVCQDLLTEAEKKFVAEGGTILSGRFQTAGVKNGNGRMYSETILRREMLYAIDQFVMNGGALLVMMDPYLRFNRASNMINPSPSKEINDISDIKF